MRWIEPDPHVAGKLYVVVEAGAQLRAADRGESWHDRVPDGVNEHATAAGFVDSEGKSTLGAHDLRRTPSALALKGNVALRQIQQMLRHASITTTEKYLEPMRSLQVTAGDYIQIELALVAE